MKTVLVAHSSELAPDINPFKGKIDEMFTSSKHDK